MTPESMHQQQNLGSHCISNLGGTVFNMASQDADHVELCLFDAEKAQAPTTVIPLSKIGEDLWHIFVEGVQPGQLYGYRVYGPFDPQKGMRFNPNKLLVDPYARIVTRTQNWHESMLGSKVTVDGTQEILDPNDSAPYAPLSMVADESFDWQGDRHPQVPWEETFIYECHVKGFTYQHPSLPEALRGTYLGLAHEDVLAYFKELGITTVELLPIYAYLDEYHLLSKGLVNYWGYNPLNWFAPEQRYRASTNPNDVLIEFKEMVRCMHTVGLEVILDVVYNHTAEGDPLGPTVSFKGLDNRLYYQLNPNASQYYENWSGCGNAVNPDHPRCLEMILASLRYWAEHMHVDGFRFDLAPTIARQKGSYTPHAPLFKAIEKDPVLKHLKWIAEPWDLGPEGFRLGGFPNGWHEWNTHFKQSMRQFWKGDSHSSGEWAQRFCGSEDLFAQRSPMASIHYIASHDGFTLQDLISYSHKRNQANGEENRDGDDHNSSWNCGQEGPSEDSKVIDLRERSARNLLTSLFLASGVPMLTQGDEIGRSQQGNNNAYCQDNALSWMPWDWSDSQHQRHAFVQALIQKIKTGHLPKQKNFFTGQIKPGIETKDITWLRDDGTEMSPSDWEQQAQNTINCVIKSEKEQTQLFWIYMNSTHKAVTLKEPQHVDQGQWRCVWNSATYEQHDVMGAQFKGTCPPYAVTVYQWSDKEFHNE